MCIEIVNILKYFNPDIIVIEKLNVGRNMVSVRQLSKIIGSVYYYSIFNNCFYFEIQASQWRKQIGIQSSRRKREEYKQMSIEYIRDRFKIDVSDDEADAICAGIGYIKMFS